MKFAYTGMTGTTNISLTFQPPYGEDISSLDYLSMKFPSDFSGYIGVQVDSAKDAIYDFTSNRGEIDIDVSSAVDSVYYTGMAIALDIDDKVVVTTSGTSITGICGVKLGFV